MVLRNSKKIVIFSIILLTFLGLLFYNKGDRAEIYSQSEFFMDTLVTIKVSDHKGVQTAVNRSFSVMKEWAEKLDRYNKNSIIAEINNKGVDGVRVSEEIIDLFTVAAEYYRLSNGAFDITIAPLLDLWGFGGQKQQVPDPEQIKKVLSKIGFARINIDRKNNIIYLAEGMKVDLGGMAKGFIVDKGIKSLKDSGIKSAFIDAGGNIRVLGKKYRNNSWHIGIRKPRERDKIFSNYVLSMETGSVATSGDYERYFVSGGKRYSHLLDPLKGYPVREMQAATIYAPDALTADLLSTAVFILGWEDGQKLIEKFANIEGFLVKDEKNIWLSSGFEDLVTNQ